MPVLRFKEMRRLAMAVGHYEAMVHVFTAPA